MRMEWKKGLIVRSCAGRDKDIFLVVIEVLGDYMLICDGKRRSLEHPKRKKRMHLCQTKTVVPMEKLQTNREIRQALRPFQEMGD